MAGGVAMLAQYQVGFVPLRMRGAALFGAAVVLTALSAPAPAQKRAFRVEETTIRDIHRAILARQLTATELVNAYLKRIEAYNGTCVKGAIDPATALQLGDIEPIEHAGKLNALITINVRGKRSKTDTSDTDSAMPDALETAKALDQEFARTGRLKGPLHGIVFAVKDQFDTFDMRTTSGAAANYANDRPPRDAEIIPRLRNAGALTLAGYDPRDAVTAASAGQMPNRSYESFAGNATLKGVRIGVVREFMRVFSKADEDSIRIANQAIADLAKAGATIVDPGPDGALFKDAIAELLPGLNAPLLAALYKELFPASTPIVDTG